MIVGSKEEYELLMTTTEVEFRRRRITVTNSDTEGKHRLLLFLLLQDPAAGYAWAGEDIGFCILQRGCTSVVGIFLPNTISRIPPPADRPAGA